MKKFLNDLKNGFFLFLPLVIFVLILIWIFKLLIGSVSWIIDLLPLSIHVLPSVALDCISLLILFLVVWIVGVIFNHYYLGKKIKKIFSPIIEKIPLLNSLYRITNQVKSTLENSESFKSVVLIEYPHPGLYSIGFLTNDENPANKKDYIVVFIPTAPNPTNGFLQIVHKDKVEKLDIPVSTAITYVISMGTAIATEKGLQEFQTNEGSTES